MSIIAQKHITRARSASRKRYISRIARLAVMDHAAISRTILQHTHSVTHNLVLACTIRRNLQQSGMFARRPMLP
ncbi:hypothetical protein TNCV_3762751 [Trichonephila clavipes]|nr:hypothetical protein TNCV_3762751 [Trichonephila clavipes]